MVRLVQVGDKYNRLEVLRHTRTDGHYRKYWECRCDCGNTIVTHSGSLRSGNTKSCGCLGREVRQRQRKPNNSSEVTAVILGYKRHAARRGYEWSLAREDVERIISEPCHYCGAPPSNIKTTKSTIEPLVYGGIDRKDNTQGYAPGNVVPCCATCNVAKGTKSLPEFAEWAIRIGAMAAQWGSLA